MSRRRGRGYYGFWPEYVPVAERRADAARTMQRLREQGEQIQPVAVEGRTIARTFWGKGWCTHLESFGDYSNRLPRGRSYVRNGSVCHLAIQRGRVEAQVAGSSLYRVVAEIKPLSAGKWADIKRRCAGRIGSLIELLQGKLSDEIMGAVTDRAQGLFPQPGEIKYTCDCPDWADMCKHVSAVMYGVGARLDERPELLFLLRGVDHTDLVSGEAAAAAAIEGSGSRRGRRRKLADADLTSVFGVELEAASPAAAEDGVAARRASRPRATRRTAVRKDSVRAAKTAKKKTVRRPAKRTTPKAAPFKATGQAVRKLRKQHAMTVDEFADAVGVSPATVTNWERRRGPIRPHTRSLSGLQRLHKTVRGS